MQTLFLRRLSVADEAGLGELFVIYETAFPASERKSAAALRGMLARGEYYFFLAKEADRTVGFAIVCSLSNGGSALLEYLAIAIDDRGRGLGREMMAAVAERFASYALLIEVESDAAECADQAMRRQRKHFYRSLGAREIEGLRWLMPQVAGVPPPAMEMMVMESSRSFIEKVQLRQWLVEIYVEVYGQQVGDPRIDAMLLELPDALPLI